MLVLGVAAAREARLQKRTTGERASIHAIALQQRRNHGNATASRYRSLLLQAVDGLPPSERTLAQGLLGKLDPLVLSQLTRGARRARRQLDNATSAPPNNLWRPTSAMSWRWRFNTDATAFALGISSPRGTSASSRR